jgi:hypothetical protein
MIICSKLSSPTSRSPPIDLPLPHGRSRTNLTSPWVVGRRCTRIVLGPGRCLKLWGRFSKAAIDSSTAAPPTPDATTAVISLEQGMPNTADESMVIAEADTENSAERTEAETEAEEKVQLLLTEVLQRCDSILETLSTCSSDLRRVKGGVVDRGTTSGVVLSGAIGVIRGGRGTKILTAASRQLREGRP